jgi:probable F420-dependent oxidoreductase
VTDHPGGTTPRPDQLGCYLLPGRIVDPNDATGDALAAERLGLQSVWISERWEQKEAPALLGAIAASTTRVRLGTAMVHPHTRHPVVLAAAGLTLQAVSRGRFTLGLARGIPGVWSSMGLPPVTSEVLRDCAGILRRLWDREAVTYSGPLGELDEVSARHGYDGQPPPIAVAAIGPETLALAGAVFDGVILHPLLSPAAVARSAELVRTAAADAGRDPSTVRVYATVVVAPDLPPSQTEAVVGGRAITYLQTPVLGDAIARANGWDPGEVERIRHHPAFGSLGNKGVASLADQRLTLDELADVARDIPEGWLRDGTAVGAVPDVATRLQRYLDAGADELILHGPRPAELGSLVEHCQRT